jgi:hypothetical protein
LIGRKPPAALEKHALAAILGETPFGHIFPYLAENAAVQLRLGSAPPLAWAMQ